MIHNNMHIYSYYTCITKYISFDFKELNRQMNAITEEGTCRASWKRHWRGNRFPTGIDGAFLYVYGQKNY